MNSEPIPLGNVLSLVSLVKFDDGVIVVSRSVVMGVEEKAPHAAQWAVKG